MADAKMNETKTRKSLHVMLRDLGHTTESFLSAEGKNFLATFDNQFPAVLVKLIMNV